ncbi:MAG TPA: MmcQ/YjbR family DNA-binding protein [Candidatus Polarisedimenticolaceae bacterium]|nr:MmcQ/YjbR family DNA-binding protein [Candidatus Polarisedimenticolaceae bacterium]
MSKDLKRIEAALRKQALAYPEVTEDFPWGHRALKVKGKAFLFMALEEGELSFSMKLPASATGALTLPFTEPTGYGLGKHGWVTATLRAGRKLPPLDLFAGWVEESYRSIAPRTLLRKLDGASGSAKAR